MFRFMMASCLLLMKVRLDIPPGGANVSSKTTANLTDDIPGMNRLSRIVPYEDRDILVCPRFSCVGRCFVPPENITIANCFCDVVCSFYGDCCFDVDEACGPDSTLSSDQLQPLANQQPHCSNIIQDEYALLIDQCSESWPRDATRQRCEDERLATDEDIFLILPVTGKAPQIAYKSIYCALCNNVSPGNVEMWKLKLNCPLYEDLSPIHQGEMTLTQIPGLEDSGCRLSMRPGDEDMTKHVRYCNPNFVNTCRSDVDPSVTSGYSMKAREFPEEDLSRVCTKYAAYVISKDSKFVRHIVKNTHCALCLNESINATELSCPAAEELLLDFHRSLLGIGLPPFSLILDFNGYHWRPTLDTSEAEIAQCSNGSFYIDGDCREGRCKENFHREGDICLPTIYQDHGLLMISFSVNIEENNMNSVENFFSEEAADHGVVIENVTSEFHQDELFVHCGGLLPQLVEFPTVFDYDLGISSNNISLFDVVVYMDDLVIDSSSFTFVNLKVNNGGFLDFNESVCEKLENLILEIDENRDIFFTTNRGIRYKPGEVFFEITWINSCDSGLVRATTEKTVIGCPLPESGCLFVPVSEEELAELEDALSDGTGNYSRAQVTEIDGQTYVCGEVFKGGQQPETVTFNPDGDIVESIITAVLLSLSLTALLCTVLTYCFNPRLRSLPGKIVLSLSIALLLAQALFLTIQSAAEIPWLCEMIAIVEHYLWLSTFTWSSVLALDLEITLTGSTKVGKNRDSEHKFILYSLYSWGVPATIVSSVVLISHFTTLPVRYGNMHLCWLMYSAAQLISFALPVGLVVIINCGLLSRAIYFIWKVSKIVKNANIVQDQKFQAFLYAKLFFLMGFTWIFGFLGSLLENKPLMYIFTIFNSLQGVYIFLAFMANKRVLGFYGKLAMHRIGNRLFSSTRSTSTTNGSKVASR